MKIKMAIIHNRSKEIKQLGNHEKQSSINGRRYRYIYVSIYLSIYFLIIHTL